MSKKKVEKELEVKTYEEWAKELFKNEGIEILDPDGFDRSNSNFTQEKYTKEEFEKGLGLCTICQNKKMKDMSKEDLKKLDKSYEEAFALERATEIHKEKAFTNIKKLKCDYTTYKEQRRQHNMPVEEVCSKCGKSFEAGEEIYTTFEEGKLGSQIICGNCAKGE